MRQSDRRTADTVLNIAKSVKEPSRMLQRVAIVISEHKTVTPFDEFEADSVRNRPSSVEESLPSGAQAEQLTFGAMLKERRKIEEEKLRKEEEKQKGKVNHPAEKSKTRPKNPFLM